MKMINVILLGLFCLSPVWANQWPQFRGPNSDQLLAEQSLPEGWGSEKNIQWQMKMPGRAWSSPVVWGEKVFVTTVEVVEEPARKKITPTDDCQWKMYCLNKDSGEVLWSKVALQGKPTFKTHAENTYASETPVTDGERVYAYFGMKGLYCYDVEGNLLWEKDLGVYPMNRDWGTSSSPLIHEGMLYLQIDNEEQSFLVALDGKTGAERWRIDREEKSNWCTPIIWKNSQRTELVAGGMTTRGYSLSGELLWELKVGGGRCSASPTASGEYLYFGTEKRKDGGFLFAVKAGASGDITPKEGETTSSGVLWSQPDSGVAFSSPLVYQNLVYILGRKRGAINCFDALTGERIYSENLPDVRTFWSTPWVSNGKIFCLDVQGTTHVVQAGRTFNILGSNKLDDAFYASCAQTEDSIILRGEESLYCIREKAP